MVELLYYGEDPFLSAERGYAVGELVLALGDTVAAETDPRRIQVTSDHFILPPRLLCHSCSPNAYIDWGDMTLKADRDIRSGELVTYHYGTSELDYAVGAFVCRCGSPSCVGYFKGFLYLEPTQQAELYERASPYIQQAWSRRHGGK